MRGVMGSLLMMLEQGATHVGVATDHVIESFRNDLWAGYKTSAGMPPELLAQFPLLEDALGRSAWPCGRWSSSKPTTRWRRRPPSPAMDPARRAGARSAPPTRTSAQCVEDPVVVQLDRRREGTVIDEAGVRAKFGVGPALDPRLPRAGRRLRRRVPGPARAGARSRPRRCSRATSTSTRSPTTRATGTSRCAARRSSRSTLAAARDAADAVPRPRDAAHARRRRRRRRLGVARARAASSRSGPSGSAPRHLVAPCDPSRRTEEVATMEDARADGGRVHVLRRVPTARPTASSCSCCTASRRRRTSGASSCPALAAAGYRAVAPDQRGTRRGARPENVDEYKIGELASDAVGFADALGVDRFHLVGHDWGGAVAWYVAGSITATASARSPSCRRRTPRRSRTRSRSGEQREKSAYMLTFREPSAEDCSSTTTPRCCAVSTRRAGCTTTTRRPSTSACSREPGALTGGLNWYRANDFRADDRADHRAHDVRVVHRRHRARPGSGRSDRRRTVDGPYRFEVIDGVSHWLPEEAPDQLNALLLSHLSGNSSGA